MKKITTCIWKTLENKEKNHYSLYVNLQESENQLALKINILQYVKKPILCNISHWRDLNPRPADYESAALPAELQWHVSRFVDGDT